MTLSLLKQLEDTFVCLGADSVEFTDPPEVSSPVRLVIWRAGRAASSYSRRQHGRGCVPVRRVQDQVIPLYPQGSMH